MSQKWTIVQKIIQKNPTWHQLCILTQLQLGQRVLRLKRTLKIQIANKYYMKRQDFEHQIEKLKNPRPNLRARQTMLKNRVQDILNNKYWTAQHKIENRWHMLEHWTNQKSKKSSTQTVQNRPKSVTSQKIWAIQPEKSDSYPS